MQKMQKLVKWVRELGHVTKKCHIFWGVRTLGPYVTVTHIRTRPRFVYNAPTRSKVSSSCVYSFGSYRVDKQTVWTHRWKHPPLLATLRRWIINCRYSIAYALAVCVCVCWCVRVCVCVCVVRARVWLIDAVTIPKAVQKQKQVKRGVASYVTWYTFIVFGTMTFDSGCPWTVLV